MMPSTADMATLEAIEAVTVKDAPTIRAAAQSLNEVVRRRGFRIAASSDIASKKQLTDGEARSINETVFGWSDPTERWWEKRHVALNSPIALACRYESETFWINAEGVHGVRANRLLRQIKFRKFFESNRRYSALMVTPIRLPFGSIGVMCFAPLDEASDDLSAQHSEHGIELAVLSHRFLSSYSKLETKADWIPPDCTLTRRQAQCLHWAAMGKTDNETGLILSLSHAAVRYHIGAAIERLDCVNRTQAVFRAGQLGYIGALD